MSATSDRTDSFAGLDEWLEWLETLHPKKIDMGLERVVRVLAALDLSDPPFRVVTVGGTNGKGSCVAILESIYKEAGFRTGAYTSPHLWRFNERLRIGGREASDAEIVGVFRQIEAARGEISLSYFEYTTIAAIAWFASNAVDIAILEVGLGGRFDAVNAVDPDVSLIVSIDLDHQEWLGDTREDIASEKAGIMRAGRPAIVADEEPPATIIAAAANVGAELHLYGRDFHETAGSGGWRCVLPRWRSAELPLPGFGGHVRLRNASACVAAVRALHSVLPVGDEDMQRGIRRAAIRGRVERHVLNGVEWIFDVAHNPAAARILAEELRAADPGGRTFAVFAAMSDKDVRGVIRPFVDKVDVWLTVRVDGERAATAEDLKDVLLEEGARSVDSAASVASACKRLATSTSTEDRVIVFGSCYVVGPAMTSLGLYSAPSLLGP
ncbi:MAG TPA: bifunctional tetrahydrofolate synthase/dihydrofolate synthase [Gammaproteobacteria bacterium]